MVFFSRPSSGDAVSSGRVPAVVAWVFALAVSLVVVSVLVVTSSIAAFSDTTDNTGNSFSTGTVVLSDDDVGAMFTVTNLIPGQSVQDCITVTYSGSVTDPAAVRMYSGGYTDSGDLDTYLDITIDEGTGGSFGNCATFVLENTIEPTGTLAAFDTAHTNYATGAGVWDPASTPESKTYRVTVGLDAAAPDTEQGESITALNFTWEVQS